MKFIAIILTTVIGVAIIIAMYGLSWIIVTGMLWAIAWCFSIPFSIKIATGIWVALVLLKMLLTPQSGNGNSR